MPNQELISYIKDAFSQGLTKDQIVIALLNSKWQEQEISEAFAFLSPQIPVPQQPSFAQQAYVPEENTVNQQPVTLHKTSKRKKIFAISSIIIVILFLLISTVTTLFAYDKLPIKNYDLQNKIADILMQIPFMPKTPRFVLESSANAHLKVTKFSFDASIAADSSNLNSMLGTGSFDAQVTGSVDYTDIKKPLAELNAQITKDLNLDFRTKEQILYFRVNSIPTVIALMLNSFGFTEAIQKQVLGKWLFIDTKPLATDARTALNNSNDNKSTIQQGFKDYLDAFNNPDILKSLSMTDEKMNNVNVYHINFAPNDSVLNVFWNKYTKKNQGNTNISSNPSYKISDTIKNFVVDIWIDKNSYFIQKSSVRFIIKSSNTGYTDITNPLGMLGSQKQDIPVSISVKLSNFNQNVNVEVPNNAAKFDDFVKSLMSQMQPPKNQNQATATTPTPLTTPTPIPTISASTIGFTLKNGVPGKTVIATVTNPQGITSISYELSYMTQGGLARGAIGVFDLTKSPVSKEITLGSCASVCTYDQGVYDLKLILKLTKTDGITYQSQATLSN